MIEKQKIKKFGKWSGRSYAILPRSPGEFIKKYVVNSSCCVVCNSSWLKYYWLKERGANNI